MEEKEQKSYYDESERKNPLIKLLIIIFVVLVLFVIGYFVLASMSKKTTERMLLETTKKYYEQNESLLPTSEGDCTTLTLAYLVSENKIDNAAKYSSCDDKNTYVKVCKLPSGKYQYTPFISCGTSDDTVFDDYKVGKESNLVADQSDVRFKFMPKIYTSNDKVYYPNGKTSPNEVVESYVSAPTNEYNIKGEAVSNAAKWYKETSGTTYWNNGAYSSTAPSGYPTKGEEGTPIVKTSLTSPAAAEYRTIESVTLYRMRATAGEPKAVKWDCTNPTIPGQVYSSDIPCFRRTDGFNGTSNIHYSCDGGKTYVEKNATCPASDWSAWTTEQCISTNTSECESKSGYKYTDRTWKWYVTGSYRSYYPSGSANAAGEKTYYTSAPASGYQRDSSTVTTAYKYYKLVPSTNQTAGGEWVSLSDSYLELEDMIKAFEKEKIEVSSLDDIRKNDKITYSTQIEYANRK